MGKTQRQFKRQFLGYRRRAVDDHLAVVDSAIAELREALSRAAEPDQHDLVLRATRLAVEGVMQQAHDEAARVLSEAEAEAGRLLADALERISAGSATIDLRTEDALPIDLTQPRRRSGSPAHVKE